MLDFDWRDDAQRALALPAALQRKTGDVPALRDVGWVSSAGLAELALCWYRLGELSRADAALAALYRHQQPDGGFLGSWGRAPWRKPDVAYSPRRETVATACLALQGALLQVRSTFASHSHDVPESIASEDGRLLAVRDFLAGLPPGSRVADIGCGAGRYLHWLRQWFPDYRWIGIDASADALARLPGDIESVRGSLLNLPCADGQFDAVYCVEALEHSLLPARAIAELCRVVRPGGRVLVIDKHRRFQSLSEHQPWEIWFKPDEVCALLSRFCENVACTPAGHGPHAKSTGLFLCWTALRGRAMDAVEDGTKIAAAGEPGRTESPGPSAARAAA
jgi:malonyl-CoA O-methyltransferase